MTELSEKILSSYQVRKTKKQKTDFIAFMKNRIPELHVEEGGALKSRNLVVGDVKNARVVFGAHYDTCARLPFPNLIAPKNMLFTILYALLVTLPFFILLVGVDILVMFLTDNFLLAYWASLAVFFALYFFVFIGGPANRHTVNDNTSGVITLCELMHLCREKGICDVAFVFFDHEEAGIFGSSYFRRMHKKEMKGKLLINFDCVSDGDHILCVLNKPAMKGYGQVLRASLPTSDRKKVYVEKDSNTFYPSDQMGFHTAMAISAMKKKRLIGLYLDRIHTKRDTVMDEANIAYICEGMESFLAEICDKNA